MTAVNSPVKPLVKLTDASLAFDNRVVWSNLNLEVRPGEFIAVIGANGSGKSTTMRMMVGLDRPTEGSVRYDGAERFDVLPLLVATDGAIAAFIGVGLLSMVAAAVKAEEVGFDVFATGEHHNPPFAAPANPPVLLAHIAAKTERILLSTSTTLITTNDPVKIAEDYAMLQHLAEGRVDLMMGRGNTGPVYPWFGKDIREGIPLAVEAEIMTRYGK